MGVFAWKPYVPVAKRRQQATQKIARLKKKGQTIDPVSVDGRTIVRSFWGKAWCDDLERYSDYENRLPRGRTYVRNGSVIDLQISEGSVKALVSGSDIYTVSVTVAPVSATRWKAICHDCAGRIDSLIELLQGQLSKAVMDRVCQQGSGLFPSPKEIKLACSCPDWAAMCKHVAAVLYGIGARLDARPELLFKLRKVNEAELLATTGKKISLSKTKPAPMQVLHDDDLGALFDLEMAETTVSAPPHLNRRGKSSTKKASPTREKASVKKKIGKKKAATGRKTTATVRARQ